MKLQCCKFARANDFRPKLDPQRSLPKATKLANTTYIDERRMPMKLARVMGLRAHKLGSNRR